MRKTKNKLNKKIFKKAMLVLIGSSFVSIPLRYLGVQRSGTNKEGLCANSEG